MANNKILYCAYGRAGCLVLNILIKEFDILPTDLLCFTYRYEENRQLIEALEKSNIRYKTDSLKKESSKRDIVDFAPDVIVSMHYRNLIPSQILQMSQLGGFNLHPSLLPKYRGCFSAPWAIINGECKSGITYHHMNGKFDDDNIILQETIDISDEETGYSLFQKLLHLGVSRFEKSFDLVVREKYKGSPQIGKPSYFPRKVPYDGYIDHQWDQSKIERFIRAMTFPSKPCAKAMLNGKEIEINDIDTYLELFS